jgi:hypothetical protein
MPWSSINSCLEENLGAILALEQTFGEKRSLRRKMSYWKLNTLKKKSKKLFLIVMLKGLLADRFSFLPKVLDHHKKGFYVLGEGI